MNKVSVCVGLYACVEGRRTEYIFIIQVLLIFFQLKGFPLRCFPLCYPSVSFLLCEIYILLSCLFFISKIALFTLIDLVFSPFLIFFQLSSFLVLYRNWQKFLLEMVVNQFWFESLNDINR